MSNIVIQIVGYAFLVMGILGLFLPVLQGVLFLLVGLILLSRSASWAKRCLAWARRQHRHVDSVIGKAEELADRWETRLSRRGRSDGSSG